MDWISASPSQGVPPALRSYPFFLLGEERLCESKVSLDKDTTKCPRPGLEPGPVDPHC